MNGSQRTARPLPRVDCAAYRAIAAMLFAFCGSAAADWTPLAADNGIYSAYADSSTIRKQGDIVSMHGMYDFTRGDSTPDGQGYFSTTVLREYDCRNRRVRLISHADHAEHFAAGRVVQAAHRPRPWQGIVDGSVDDAFWKLACRES